MRSVPEDADGADLGDSCTRPGRDQSNNRLGAKCCSSGVVGTPCGPAEIPPAGGSLETIPSDLASSRVICGPDGRRVLAWVPASALGLLGPILRRNGLVVGEETAMLERGEPIPGMVRIREIQHQAMRRANRRGRDWLVTAAWVLIAVCLIAAVLHIAWTREERLPGRGTLSPAALVEMPTQDIER